MTEAEKDLSGHIIWCFEFAVLEIGVTPVSTQHGYTL